ncbi:MAG: tetratricopeptide repeat protein [Chitinophagales bacterium]
MATATRRIGLFLWMLLFLPLQHFASGKPQYGDSIQVVEVLVRKPDWFSNIADRFHVSRAVIARASHIKASTQHIYAGKLLRIPMRVIEKGWDPMEAERKAAYPRETWRPDPEVYPDLTFYDPEVADDFLIMSDVRADSIQYKRLGNYQQVVSHKIKMYELILDSVKKVEFSFNYDSSNMNALLERMKMAREQYYTQGPIGQKIDSLHKLQTWMNQRMNLLHSQQLSYEELVENAPFLEAQGEKAYNKSKTNEWGDQWTYESWYSRWKYLQRIGEKGNRLAKLTQLEKQVMNAPSNKRLKELARERSTARRIEHDGKANNQANQVLVKADTAMIGRTSDTSLKTKQVTESVKINLEDKSSGQQTVASTTATNKSSNAGASNTDSKNVVVKGKSKQEDTAATMAKVDRSTENKNSEGVKSTVATNELAKGTSKQEDTAATMAKVDCSTENKNSEGVKSAVATNELTKGTSKQEDTAATIAKVNRSNENKNNDGVKNPAATHETAKGTSKREDTAATIAKVDCSNENKNNDGVKSTAATHESAKGNAKQEVTAATATKAENNKDATSSQPPQLDGAARINDTTAIRKTEIATGSAWSDTAFLNRRRDSTAALYQSYSSGKIALNDEKKLNTDIDSSAFRRETRVSEDPLNAYKTDSNFVMRTVEIKEIPVIAYKNRPKYLMPVDSVSRIKADFYMIRARNSLEHGDFKEGEKFLRKSLELNPNNAAAWMLHADLYLTTGLVDKALKEYVIASEIDSTNPKVFYNMALLFIKANDDEKGFQYLSKAIDLNEKYLLAYMGRASLLVKQRDYLGAINDYDEVLKINKFYTPAMKQRGLVKMEAHLFESAVKDFDSYLEIEDPDGYVLYQRGISKCYSKNLLQGCLDFSSALELGFKEAERAIKHFCQ